MTRIPFYGEGLAGFTRTKLLPGRLIVLEGTDGVGRSTQIALLHEWLESKGYAVRATGLKRSKLAGKGITGIALPQDMGWAERIWSGTNEKDDWESAY